MNLSTKEQPWSPEAYFADVVAQGLLPNSIGADHNIEPRECLGSHGYKLFVFVFYCSILKADPNLSTQIHNLGAQTARRRRYRQNSGIQHSEPINEQETGGGQTCGPTCARGHMDAGG